MALRFFISHDALAALVMDDEGTFDGEWLRVPSRRLEARVEPALYFVREVEGKADPNDLVGKVKTQKVLAALGADHFRKSVILGDTAYDVVEGYLGTAAEGWTWPDGATATRVATSPDAAGPAAAPAPAPSVPPATALLPPDDDEIPIEVDLSVLEGRSAPEGVQEASAGAGGATGFPPSLPLDERDQVESSGRQSSPATPASPPGSRAADRDHSSEVVDEIGRLMLEAIRSRGQKPR